MDKLVYTIVIFSLLSCASTKNNGSSELSYEQRDILFRNIEKIEKDTSSGDVLFIEANKNNCPGKWEQTVQKAKEDLYVAKSKGKAKIWFQLGNCFNYIDDFERSILYYELVESSGTRDTKLLADVNYSLGNIYLKMNQREIAESYFNSARKLDDPKSLSLFQLGILELSDGEYKQSIKKFNDLAKKYPKSNFVQYFIGVNYYYLRELKALHDKVLPRIDDKFLGKSLLEVALKLGSEEGKRKIKEEGILDNIESDNIYFEKFKMNLLQELKI